MEAKEETEVLETHIAPKGKALLPKEEAASEISIVADRCMLLRKDATSPSQQKETSHGVENVAGSKDYGLVATIEKSVTSLGIKALRLVPKTAVQLDCAPTDRKEEVVNEISRAESQPLTTAAPSVIPKQTSTDAADAPAAKGDESEPASSKNVSSLGRKTLPSACNSTDQLECAPTCEEELVADDALPSGNSKPDTSAPISDAQGNLTRYNQNDIFLCRKNPAYNAIMLAEFKKLGEGRPGNSQKTKSVNKVFQRLKKGGGRFFTLENLRSHEYVEVDEEAALRKIKIDIANRKRCHKQWCKETSPAESPQPVLSACTGIPTKYNQNDNFLCENNSAYIAIMLAEFEKLGRGTPGRAEKMKVAKDLFQRLKKRGGRFFTIQNPPSHEYVEVDEEAALKKIYIDIGKRKQWRDDASSAQSDQPAPSAPLGDPTKYNQSDVLLSFKNLSYKAIMFAEFKKLGKGRLAKADRENVVNEVFQRFQKRGGRFFKLLGRSSCEHMQVEEEVALKRINIDFQTRMNSYKQWGKEKSSSNKPAPSAPLGSPKKTSNDLTDTPGIRCHESRSTGKISVTSHKGNVLLSAWKPPDQLEHVPTGRGEVLINEALPPENPKMPTTNPISDNSGTTSAECPQLEHSACLGSPKETSNNSVDAMGINVNDSGTTGKISATSPRGKVSLSTWKLPDQLECAPTDEEEIVVVNETLLTNPRPAASAPILDDLGTTSAESSQLAPSFPSGSLNESSNNSMDTMGINCNESRTTGKISATSSRGEVLPSVWKAPDQLGCAPTDEEDVVLVNDTLCTENPTTAPSIPISDDLGPPSACLGSPKETSNDTANAMGIKYQDPRITGRVSATFSRGNVSSPAWKMLDQLECALSDDEEVVENETLHPQNHKPASFAPISDDFGTTFTKNAQPAPCSSGSPKEALNDSTESMKIKQIIATSPRGKVSPLAYKPPDPLECAPTDQEEVMVNETWPTDDPKPAPLAPISDCLGYRTEYKQNDVFLCLSNPAYRAIMFAEFKKLRQGKANVAKTVEEVFQSLKKGGGKFFRLRHCSNRDFMEVDAVAAIKKIRTDFQGQNSPSKQWRKEWKRKYPAESPKPTTSAPCDKPTQYNQTDVFMSFKSPIYKAAIFAAFKKLGRGKGGTTMVAVANEVFQSLKRGGGRFFKLLRSSSTEYTEVDEEAALKKICTDIKRRNAPCNQCRNKTSPAESLQLAPSAPWVKPTKYNQNDVFISFKNPAYRAIIFVAVKEPGVVELVANVVFQRFKKGEGKFFTLLHSNSAERVEVDEEAALNKIISDIRCRNRGLRTYDRDPAAKNLPLARVAAASTQKHYRNYDKPLRAMPPEDYTSQIDAPSASGLHDASHDLSVAVGAKDNEPGTPGRGAYNSSDQNDVFLCLSDPAYKALMFAEFKKMRPGSTDVTTVANKLFKMLKKGGGRFFMHSDIQMYVEVDEEKVLEKIRRDIGHRNRSSSLWLEENSDDSAAKSLSLLDITVSLIPKKRIRQEEVVPIKNDGTSQEIQSVGRSGRKRNRPNILMDAQGQDVLPSEELRKRSAAAQKEKCRTQNDKPFSINENREFEAGCIRHGWGNWELVQTFIAGRNAEECENYAAMTLNRYPAIKERLMDEHGKIWVYAQREELFQQVIEPTTPPHLSEVEESPMGGHDSVRSREGARKVASLYSCKALSKMRPKHGACIDFGEVARNKGYSLSPAKAAYSGCRKRKHLDTGKRVKNKNSPRKIASSRVKNTSKSGDGVDREEFQCSAEENELRLPQGKEGKRRQIYVHEPVEPKGEIKDEASDKSKCKSATKAAKLKLGWTEREKDVVGSVKQSKTASHVKAKQNRAKKEDVELDNNSAHPIVDANPRRPKRQSAIKAIENLHESLKSEAGIIEDNHDDYQCLKDWHPRDRHVGDQHAGDQHTGDQHAGDQHAGDPHGEDPHKGDSEKGDPEKGDPEKGDSKKGDSLKALFSKQVSKFKEEKDELLKRLPDALSNGGQYYQEETAWRVHNPTFPHGSQTQVTVLRGDADIPRMSGPTCPQDLEPLPSAPPLPELPSTDFCTWSFDVKSRVLLANFRDCLNVSEKGGKIEVSRADEVFLFRMMERDDITIISEGLADSMDSSLWTRQYIEGCIGSDYHHKLRGFKTVLKKNADLGKQSIMIEQPKEKKGWYSMTFSDYFQYLAERQSLKEAKLVKTGIDEDLDSSSQNFTFTDSKGEVKSINVDQEALYMVDVDLVKLLPQVFEDFQRNFKLPGILPGGTHCMMNAVNANGRPFMGPNLYITPPTAFTHFHQDGHGTVDSGHLCLAGYNEVVMLRRLTERHKCHALQLLTGTPDTHGPLYGLPHRDDLATQPGWPSKDAIRQCKRMGYCPSVFVLKAGQVVHINKGRLHAFRKLAPSPLRETDCHFDLRDQILQTKEKLTEDICFSVAWDWMFKGVTSDGINREVSGILECARLNREHHLQSLAIPETSLLFLAKENIAKHQIQSKMNQTDSLFKMDICQQANQRDRFSEPDAKTVLRGILPSLQYLVRRHKFAVKFSEAWEDKTKNVINSWRVSIDSKPNTWQDPGTFTLDPYGAGDFFCKICSEELCNVYMHCDGCEKLLDKDFNICSTCHSEGKYKIFHQMHPFNEKKLSILNHTGNKTLLRRARCPCKNGKECRYCSYCTGCSCRCHQWFTLHYRFMGLNNELELLKQAESIVGSDIIPQMTETKARLFSLISEALPQNDGSVNDGFCQVIDAVKKPTNGRKRMKEESGHHEDVISQESTRRGGKGLQGVEEVMGKGRSKNGFKSEVHQAKRVKRVDGQDAISLSSTRNGEKSFQGCEEMMNQDSAQNGEKAGVDGGKRVKDEVNHQNVVSQDTTKYRENSEQRRTVKMRKVQVHRVDGKANESKSTAQKGVEKEGNGDMIAELDATNVPERSHISSAANVVTFYCPKCERDFAFTCSPGSACGAFANHAKHCQGRKDRLTHSKSCVLKSLVKYDSAPKDSSDDETQGSVDEGLAHVAPIDPAELKPGSRVMVLYANKGWQATILRHHTKKGEPGFMIHYDGKKKTTEDWVLTSSVVDFIHEINANDKE